jgi:hypothetical protein
MTLRHATSHAPEGCREASFRHDHPCAFAPTSGPQDPPATRPLRVASPPSTPPTPCRQAHPSRHVRRITRLGRRNTWPGVRHHWPGARNGGQVPGTRGQVPGTRGQVSGIGGQVPELPAKSPELPARSRRIRWPGRAGTRGQVRAEYALCVFRRTWPPVPLGPGHPFRRTWTPSERSDDLLSERSDDLPLGAQRCRRSEAPG